MSVCRWENAGRGMAHSLCPGGPHGIEGIGKALPRWVLENNQVVQGGTAEQEPLGGEKNRTCLGVADQ